MAAPKTSTPILSAPDPQKLKNNGWTLRFLHTLWQRSGGLTQSSSDLKGLKASVSELNMLVGIQTGKTVQQQINDKENKSSLGTMAYQNSSSVEISGGGLTKVVISDSDITIKAGNCTTCDIKLGGTLNVDMSENGNTGVGEQTLTSYTMLSDVLGEDLQFIEVTAFGTVAANANNKRIKLKFGSATIYDTGAIAANTGSWEITAKIIKTSSSQEKCIAKIISDNALIIDGSTYTLATESTNSAIPIFCTGEATLDNDIVQEGLIIKWFSN